MALTVPAATTTSPPAARGSPTGLGDAAVAELTDEEVRALQVWHAGKAGDDDGRPWWPQAVRRLPLEDRLALASNPDLDAAWESREQRRVAVSPRYFLTAYGHMQDEDGGPPVPFSPWAEQLQVIALMLVSLRLLVLKARQLGLTWIALHYAVWLMAFNPRTPRAKVLALSKTGADSRKLVKRCRRIVALLPPYLRVAEDQSTKRTNDSFKLVGRGQIDSLPGTPDAARSEQCDLLLCDEAAFYRNRGFGATWQAAQSTVGQTGQAFVITTGNGPAEAPGDGQGFAKLWERARSGLATLTTLFLPAHTDPARTPQWRAREAQRYINPEDFEAEHPETEEQALAGVSGTKVYLPAGINAAEALGAELDELLDSGGLQEPAGGLVEVCVDWGENTHMLALWPLEGGGVYVLPGEYAPEAGPSVEAEDGTRVFLGRVRESQRLREPMGVRDPWPLIGPPRYDAAGVQSMRTFHKTVVRDPQLARQFACRHIRGVPMLGTLPVPFSDYKTLGKDYLRYLFRRVAAGRSVGVIAVSPRNPVLLRQLRGLELEDDGSGRIVKGDDHGPDALIAGVAPIALMFFGRAGIEERDLAAT